MMLFLFVFTGIFIRLIMLILSIAWIAHEKKLLQKNISIFPRVSLLIPAYNEESTIVESITHAINQTYPDLEIIVVNDGSTDDTLNLLVKTFGLIEKSKIHIQESIPTQPVKGIFTSENFKDLIVINKENGGKADALNCAINASTSEYVLCVDADTFLTQNTIKYLIFPFIDDERTVVTSGSVRIISQSHQRSLFTDLQKIEFVNSISLFRSGWNFMNANLIVSGALGLFRRSIMIRVGGYHNLAIGEDMEIIIRIHRYLCDNNIQYRILQLALPCCFTTALPNISEMSKQRKRWQKGLLSSVRLNLKLFLNFRYKWVGMAGIPFYIFYEILTPFAEVFGFTLFFFVIFYPTATTYPIYIWFAGLLLAILNNWISISLDKFLLRGMPWKEYFRLLASSLSEPFIYHFFQVFFKIKGTIEYISEFQVTTVWDTKRSRNKYK